MDRPPFGAGQRQDPHPVTSQRRTPASRNECYGGLTEPSGTLDRTLATASLPATADALSTAALVSGNALPRSVRTASVIRSSPPIIASRRRRQSEVGP